MTGHDVSRYPAARGCHGQDRQRPGLGGLWPLLLPAACCGAPLLVAGLAAAGALAWGGLGLALAALLAAAVPVIRRLRARAAGIEVGRPGEPPV